MVRQRQGTRPDCGEIAPLDAVLSGSHERVLSQVFPQLPASLASRPISLRGAEPRSAPWKRLPLRMEWVMSIPLRLQLLTFVHLRHPLLAKRLTSAAHCRGFTRSLMKSFLLLATLASLGCFVGSAVGDHGPGTSGGGASTQSAETLKRGQFSLETRVEFTEFYHPRSTRLSAAPKAADITICSIAVSSRQRVCSME